MNGWYMTTSMLPISRRQKRSASSVDPFNIQIMNKPESDDEEAVPID